MENWIHSLSNNNNIVLNTQIQLARNLNDMPFVDKLDNIKAKKSNELIYETLKELLENEDITLYEVYNNEKNIYDECIDKYLITSNLLKKKDKAAFIINEDETFSIMLNEDEHIKINCITSGLNLESTFNEANEIDNKIEKNFEYAFSEKFGYLAASPLKSGTGLTISTLVHLPALTINNEVSKIAKTFEHIGVKIKSKYNDESGDYGSLYEVYTTTNFGLKEEEIIGEIKGALLNVIAEEKKAREVLLTQKKRKIMDKIYRAYAILNSAVLLGKKEAVQLLSYVRFGVELSILDIDKSKLNKAMILISDSHIKSNYGEDLTEEEIDFERADIIKQILV